MAREVIVVRESGVNPLNAERKSTRRQSSIDIRELRELGIDIQDVYTILRSDGLSETDAKDELRRGYADLLTDDVHRRVIDKLKG